MDSLNILIVGESSESIDIMSTLSGTRHNVFVNEVPSTIHIALIFDSFNSSYLKRMNNNTICLSFNPTLSEAIPNLYQCHFIEPKEGEIQTHQSFIIDTEIGTINNNFAQCYGALAFAGFDIKFGQNDMSNFKPLLAMSSLMSTELKKDKILGIKKNNDQDEYTVLSSENEALENFHLIIALDCTGSMGSSIENIKNSLQKIVGAIKVKFPNIIISFYAFRDFCDPQVINKTILKKDVNVILEAIQAERANGGGDEPEAHKTCLAEILDDVQQSYMKMTNVCLLITDAPPHILKISNSSEGRKENDYLLQMKSKAFYATDWVKLGQTLSDEGIQVFSFLTTENLQTLNLVSFMSAKTNGISFIIPHLPDVFEKQILSIISGLVNADEGEAQKIIEGIVMTSFEDPDGISNEDSFFDAPQKTQRINDKNQIKAAVTEKGLLMRLKPSDRGARRATITTDELVQTGKTAIKGLKSLYAYLNGSQTAFTTFEKQPFTFIGNQLKADMPSEKWLTDSNLSCICSMMNYLDAFEELLEFDEDGEDATDVLSLISVIGNFIISYPFLFELNEEGKFNMQDAWPIFLKDASTAYTMSFTSLFNIIEKNSKTSEDEDNSQIKKFRDFVTKTERSGIVPICEDKIGTYILRILDSTKWLDALVSYGLHRHIEPLPSITRATCCAFINKVAYQGFINNQVINESQKTALNKVYNTLLAMNSLGCNSMMSEFRQSFEKLTIPYNAFAPQNPFNCSSINKILNCFFQLHNEIVQCENINFLNSFFYQAIHEYISLKVPYLEKIHQEKLINMIFDEVSVNPVEFEIQNPLETKDPRLLTNFTYHELSHFKINNYAVFLFKLVWSLIRNDDKFVQPSELQLTSSLAQALVIQPRSFKFIKLQNDEKTNDNDDDVYEIDPMFAQNDPIEVLRTACFLYFKRIKSDEINSLQCKRYEFLVNENVSKLINAIRLIDMNEFQNVLLEGSKFDWMKTSLKLTMTNCKIAFRRIINEVKRLEPNAFDFYKEVLFILVIGKSEDFVWEVNRTFRDVDLIYEYIDQFLGNDEEIKNEIVQRFTRPMPNRHYHHRIYCPYQNFYTEEYARARIICNIAPNFFFEGNPDISFALNHSLIRKLSHKDGSPSDLEIYKFAESVIEELNTLKKNQSK
ncbi:hypothetical protein TRFO_30397 [Tritrichomonas foetus]|uniref:Hemicentin-1-like von Willebrand factor A domain-containing protein n=1 Tax=Tritrichomonas foetus TaxID=1144522 RepID=A0A1J4JVJ4_9EUKA|nr:hypothetical protein TRFO_30397 [Tritrichomonas foetus]|eukprot:OHT02456.1 hypothetical protein TRFO_30397 [Tritrichomonas foetus]